MSFPLAHQQVCNRYWALEAAQVEQLSHFQVDRIDVTAVHETLVFTQPSIRSTIWNRQLKITHSTGGRSRRGRNHQAERQRELPQSIKLQGRVQFVAGMAALLYRSQPQDLGPGGLGARVLGLPGREVPNHPDAGVRRGARERGRSQRLARLGKRNSHPPALDK
eukprot:7031463-Pyramimonas_sp.AAC.1